MRQALFALWAAGLGAALTSCVDRFEVGTLGGVAGAGGDGGAAPGGGGAGGEGGGPPLVDLEPFTTALALASASSCALRANGGVACWGTNTSGELGVGNQSLTGSSTPLTPVGQGAGALAIFGGGIAHCVLGADHRVDCWGGALYGEFQGVPVQALSFAPLELPGIGDDVVQITLGIQWGCALTSGGQAKCWGLGGTGQLGTGTTNDAYVPTDVASIEGERYVFLSASGRGFHTCGVTSAGGVSCWGDNGAGQLGYVGENALVPSPVPPLGAPAVEVAAGGEHTCARLEDQRVFCWGDNLGLQLGSEGSAPEPREVTGIAAQTIAAGGDQTCALTTDGAVWCWGTTAFGDPSLPAIEIDASFGALHVVTSGLHGCAMNAAHVVRCWGLGDQGQTAGGEVAL